MIVQPLRVLLVSGHEVTLIGLGRVLQRDPQVQLVGSVSPDAAPERTRALRPNVVCLDKPAARADATLILAHTLRRNYPELGMVLYAELERLRVVLEAERLQAAVLSKSDDLKEMFPAIRAAGAGKGYLSPRFTEVARSSTVRLSARQLDVLRLLATGVDGEEIAGELGLGEETVKTHIRGLCRNLGVSGRTEAVAKAIRLGLI